MLRLVGQREQIVVLGLGVETLDASGHLSANVPYPEDSDQLAGHLECVGAGDRFVPSALARGNIAGDQLSVDRQHQEHGMVSNGPGVGAAIVAAGDAEFGHQPVVHPIVPGCQRLDDASLGRCPKHVVRQLGAVHHDEISVGDGPLLLVD